MEKKEAFINYAIAASDYDKEKEYWLQKFSGVLPESSFPYDRAKEKAGRRSMETLGVSFSGGIYKMMMKVGKNSDYVLHMILTAGVFVLLHKYTGHEDIVVGVPIYKQEQDAAFLNTVLPLRMQLESRAAFKALLIRVRQTMVEANENQNYPMETLLFRLNIPFSEGDFPLFDVAVLLENIHEKKYIRSTYPNILFSFLHSEAKVEGVLEYDALLYERSTIERIAAHLKRLLEEAFFNLDIPLMEIEILSQEEKSQLLVDFNDTGREYPAGKTIDELFEEQAAGKPDRLALTYEREPVTYGRLNEEANALAGYLRFLGVRTGEPVAALAQNSHKVIVSVLAILKAGGAYLPMNSEYPAERRRYILKDCQVKILLTNCNAPCDHVQRVVDLEDSLIYQEYRHTEITKKHGSTDSAYIMYTSGSTGTPKGVIVEHRSAVRLVKNTNYIEFKEGDSILLTGALEFDASTFEIWGSLLNGLPLHLVSKDTILNRDKLKQAIRRCKATIMWMTSPLFNRMLDADIEIFTGLKNLLVGGDVLSPLHINRVRHRFPGLRVLNGYGPTENTTFSTTYPVEKDFYESIPIGKPIANSTAYILDRNNCLVPMGAVGEFFVGGDGLSRGYLNNPELTAQKFITGHLAGARLYRTGDLVKRLEDGNVEFLGRIDYQVKIRGYRVEPGEIENRLKQLVSIKDAVVIDRKNREGEKYLCAYVVPAEGKVDELDAVELRSNLVSNLPGYMSPAYFVPIEEIPLTPNGKVDRKKLPEPEINSGALYTAPRNQVEEKLVEIWCEVLKIGKDKIGIDSDFFELGGHSLTATILIARLHKALHVKIPLRELFKNPTIRELAGYMNKASMDRFSAIQITEQKEYYKLSSTQQRLYLLQQMNSNSVAYNVPQTVIIEGKLQRVNLETTCKKLLDRHESLRTSFPVLEGDPVQRINNSDDIEFAIGYDEIGSSQEAASTIERFIRPFDLSKAPLLRVGVIKLEQTKHILVVDIHHIITDGTSVGIFIREAVRLYGGEKLPEIRIHYKDFSAWQNRLLNSAEIKRQEKYWQEQFAGEIAVLDLPGDYPRPAVQTFTGASLCFEIGREETRALKVFALLEGVTLFIALLAIFAIFLAKISGREDILIGTPTGGRRHADLQFIIGMFVNTLVLRSRPCGEKNIKQFLKEVKENALAAFENQEYQFEELVEQIGVDRDVSRNPLFDVMFTLHNEADPAVIKGIETADLRLTPYEYERRTAKFDLELNIHEAAEHLSLTFTCCTRLFKGETVARFVDYFKRIVNLVIKEPGLKISGIEIISAEEKKKILFDFNDTETEYPAGRAIAELFAEEVLKNPDKTAVSYYLNILALYEKIKTAAGKIGRYLRGEFANFCFKKNPYVFRFVNPAFLYSLNLFSEQENRELFLLRTHKLNYVAVNQRVLLLLDYFDGTRNIKSIFTGMTGKDLLFLVYHLGRDAEESNFYSSARKKILLNGRFAEIFSLIETLCDANLIELADYRYGMIDLDVQLSRDEVQVNEKKEAAAFDEKDQSARAAGELKSPVLLLGGRTGPATTGLLYIASFLRRNGIEAYCRWNDENRTKTELEKEVKNLLKKINPRVVGVSMKWFLHIARALKICRIIKEFDPSIMVVVGGNTASYFREKVVLYDCIDYVIAGDGEVPFLKICRGEEFIPNCVYKKNGKIIENPITYVQDKHNSADIYLSHMDEIFVSGKDPYLPSYFYIFTGKGCSLQCFYCGGCRTAQERIFNRSKPFMRGAAEVRRDIIEAKKYTSTFWFDFDLPTSESRDYYKKIWQGCDLTDYFCEFYFWKLPGFEFLDDMVKTFKYVYINIDLCSLSEAHRMKLVSAGVVKPQPTDEELFSFFDHCANYDNLEVIINQLSGLPFFTGEDIQKSEKILAEFLKKYPFIKSLDWGRLHAQPGAPLVDTCEQYGMHSYARTFENFLHYSQLNLQEDIYPDILNFHYPYIYSQDEHLNAKISKFYVDTNRAMEKFSQEKARFLGVNLNVTYGLLDERSTRLAAVLRGRGVAPGDVVAVMLERSIEMIVALLAVLKAGGAYLPIDSTYPPERIGYMLLDSKTPVLLSRQELLDKAGGIRYAGSVIDISNEVLSEENEDKLEMVSSPADLAYILYTSGSTGTPKGVLVEHRNVVRLVKNQNYIELKEGGRLLLTGSLVFDITTFEIWASLLNSLTLYLTHQDDIIDSERLKDILVKNKINILHLVPQLFNRLSSRDLSIFAGLDYLLVGGDLVNPLYINKVRKKFARLKIRHMYGPTENTVFSTFFPVNMDFEQRIPIGKPVSNSRAYVVDSTGNLLPIGALGELVVSGDGVSRGYLNKPELTAERFVRTVISHSSLVISSSKLSPGDQCPMTNDFLYKTGDLVRWLPDGNIEFLGRIDRQVKLRGVRIEVGEIENQLLKHAEIEEVVVVAGEGTAAVVPPGDDNKYLCAYIVTTSGKEISTALLREFLLEKLPEAMIPTYFVRLAKMPLTPTGKIDRRLLPMPRAAGEAEYTAPRDVREEKIAGIWSQVLGIEKDTISINADFFELGGHSLKAASVAAQIRKEFNVEVTLLELFRNPTIKELAGYIKTCVSEKVTLTAQYKNLVLLRSGSDTSSHLFLIHGGTGQVEGYGDFCKHLTGTLNCWGIQAERLENLAPRECTVEKMARDYVEQMKGIQDPGPYNITGWSFGGAIAYEMVRQLEKGSEDTAFLVLIDSPAPHEENELMNKATGFNLESEKNFIAAYSTGSEMNKQLKHVKEIGQLWSQAAKYLETGHYSVTKITNAIGEYARQALPGLQLLSIKESIYYLNAIRTFRFAWANYKPRGRIRTPLYYFAASRSQELNKERWQDYCSEPVTFYEIPGDHFSIFSMPQVEDFAELFEKVMNLSGKSAND